MRNTVPIWVIAAMTVLGAVQPASSVNVYVVPCVDIAPQSSDQVSALGDFLQWCEKNGVKVAVFLSNRYADAYPGVKDAVVQYSRDGTIGLVGLGTASYSLGGLPVSLQYLELKFNQEFLLESGAVNVNTGVLMVPHSVFDTNTLVACEKAGVRVIVGKVDITKISPEYPKEWNTLNSTARLMVPGHWDLNGYRVYLLPGLNARDLIDQAANVGYNPVDILEGGVESLINNGIISADDSIVIGLIIDTDCISKSDYLQKVEGILQELLNGDTRTYTSGSNTVTINFKLLDPSMAVHMLTDGEVKTVELPYPNYVNVLTENGGFGRWWEQLGVDTTGIVNHWRGVMTKWWAMDTALWTLITMGSIDDDLKAKLRKAVELVWDEAYLCEVCKDIKEGKVTKEEADNELTEEEGYLDALYPEVMSSYTGLVGKLQSGLESLGEDLASLQGIVEDLSGRVKDLESTAATKDELNDVKQGLEQEIGDLKTQLSQELDGLKFTVDRLTGELKDLSEKLNALESSAALKQDVERELQAIKGELESLREKVENLESVSGQHREEIQSMERELNELEGRLKDVESKLASVMGSIGDLEQLRKRLTDAEGALKGVEDRLNSLSGELSKSKVDLNQVVKEVQTLKRTLDFIKGELGKLNGDVERLKALMGLKGQLDELRKKLHEFEQRLVTLESEGVKVMGEERGGQGAQKSGTEVSAQKKQSTQQTGKKKRKLPLIPLIPVVPSRKIKAR
ncbi:hypothetical protein [Methanopyrus sp.]